MGIGPNIHWRGKKENEMDTNRRGEFKAMLIQKLAGWDWNEGETYPYKDLSRLIADLEYTFTHWDCRLKGFDTMGESLIFHIETNGDTDVDVLIQSGRVNEPLFRWRVKEVGGHE